MADRMETMTNQDFVRFCYNRILRREPDDRGFADYTGALESNGLSREQVLIQFVTSDEFTTGAPSTNLEMFPPGHYYSAVPSADERMAFRVRMLGENDLPGVRLSGQQQFELLKKFKVYYDQSPFSAKKNDRMRYYFDNPSYSYTDGLSLFSMMKEFKPRRIIEVGAGFSSCAMLDTSELFFSDAIRFTFIEPHPDYFLSLIRESDKGHILLRKNLQDVDIGIFKALQENDILFVDSTHVCKLNSDVNMVILEILPILNSGVLVHFHDIFWPFEYPVEWIRKGIAWNEAYLLRSFLEFNEHFEVLFFASFLHAHHHEWIRENMPLMLNNGGGNIWLVKRK